MSLLRRDRRRSPLALSAVLLAAAACGGGDRRSPLEPEEPPAAQPVVAPQCTSPAPLDGTYDPRAPGYLVMLPAGVAAGEIGARLAGMYGITILRVFEAVDGLWIDATPAQVARLRCDPNVALVGFNGIVHAD